MSVIKDVFMVGTEKGGVGKSTFTQNLAVIRASLDRRVAVFDLDGQGTTTKWALRRAEHPELTQIYVERWPREKRLTEEEFADVLGRLVDQYDDVFIDVGGKDSDGFRYGLAVAEKVVAPLIPSPADLDTVPDLHELLGTYTKKIDVRVVLNQADKRKRMTKAMLKQMEAFKDRLPLMKHLVASRESYKFALAQGKGVTELTGEWWDAAAANEMKDTYLGAFGA
jgi:chromosome partitioning protein